MSSNTTKLKQQIDYCFHNTYLAKYPEKIRDMLIHLFNDGKRIRPILFIAFNHINNLDNSSKVEKVDSLDIKLDNIWIEYAIEIELLHCLSLVIDDLPEMDNEVERRGKPCFHNVFGIQKTHFFIYYMFSKLSGNLTNLLDLHKEHNSRLNIKIFDDTSFLIHYLINNLIDGQYVDITSNKLIHNDLQNVIDCNIVVIMKVILSIYNENIWIDIETDKEQSNKIIENHIMLNIKKTGTLFALPIIIGFLFQLYKKNLIYTGKEVIHDELYFPNISGDDYTENLCENKMDLGDDNMVNLIIIWASILGFFFQTSDDFLDMASDAENKKPNICNIMGIENSIKLLSGCASMIHAMFEYIIQNIKKLWPDVIIDIENVKSIIDLIESRYKNKEK